MHRDELDPIQRESSMSWPATGLSHRKLLLVLLLAVVLAKHVDKDLEPEFKPGSNSNFKMSTIARTQQKWLKLKQQNQRIRSGVLC